MTRRPPLRSATPSGSSGAVPPPPANDRAPLLGGSSLLGGRSILSGPSIFTPSPVAPDPATARSHRRPRRLSRLSGAVRRWARGPSGRFVVPLMVILTLLAAVGTAGNIAVRAGTATAPPPSPTPASPSSAPMVSGVPQAPDGEPAASPSPSAPDATPSRPQDVVAGWAARMAPVVGIPETALKAYGYATLRVAADVPTCHLSWTTLAAIGEVESGHGQANHATLASDGFALPPIIGAALDGHDGRQLLPDTDAGRWDGDKAFDHAVGPMQFVPQTWQQYAIDADQDGQADPNDLNDAALAAGRYLCAGGKDLATGGGWWAAVLSYNELQEYAKAVFTAADDYGRRSRAVA